MLPAEVERLQRACVAGRRVASGGKRCAVYCDRGAEGVHDGGAGDGLVGGETA